MNTIHCPKTVRSLRPFEMLACLNEYPLDPLTDLQTLCLRMECAQEKHSENTAERPD